MPANPPAKVVASPAAPDRQMSRVTSAAAEGNQDLALDIGAALKGLTMSIALQLDRRLECHGVTHAEWKPLRELQERPRRTTADMAAALGITPGGMTRTLDRLESKQLVVRVRSCEDRRIVALSLTDAGRRAAAVVPDIFRDVLDRHLEGFTPAERDQLQDLLQRMRSNGEVLRRRRASKD